MWNVSTATWQWVASTNSRQKWQVCEQKSHPQFLQFMNTLCAATLRYITKQIPFNLLWQHIIIVVVLSRFKLLCTYLITPSRQNDYLSIHYGHPIPHIWWTWEQHFVWQSFYIERHITSQTFLLRVVPVEHSKQTMTVKFLLPKDIKRFQSIWIKFRQKCLT